MQSNSSLEISRPLDDISSISKRDALILLIVMGKISILRDDDLYVL